MKMKKVLTATVLSLALGVGVAPSADAWLFFRAGLYLPDEDVIYAPEPAPAPAKEPAAPAPAPRTSAYDPPDIPAPVKAAPAPKVVVDYVPPAPRIDTDNSIPSWVRSMPWEDQQDYRQSQQPVIPAPAPTPAPVSPAVPTPAVTTSVSIDRFIETSLPTDKPLKVDGTTSVQLKTVNFYENTNVFTQPTKAENAMTEAIRKQAELGMTIIRVEGYADPQGSYAANQILSDKRAAVVQAGLEVMLEERGFSCGAGNGGDRVCTDTKGGPAITLQAVGFSESNLISKTPAGCNANHDNRAMCDKAFAPNRRTEIKMAEPVVSVPVVQKVTKPEPTCEELGTCEVPPVLKPDPTCEELGTCDKPAEPESNADTSGKIVEDTPPNKSDEPNNEPAKPGKIEAEPVSCVVSGTCKIPDEVAPKEVLTLCEISALFGLGLPGCGTTTGNTPPAGTPNTGVTPAPGGVTRPS